MAVSSPDPILWVVFDTTCGIVIGRDIKPYIDWIPQVNTPATRSIMFRSILRFRTEKVAACCTIELETERMPGGGKVSRVGVGGMLGQSSRRHNMTNW